MAIKIATLFAEVTARTRGFDRGVDRVESRTQRLKTNFRGLATGAAAAGAAVTAVGFAFIKSANKAAEYADRIDKTAERTDLARSTLQELDFVASQLGTSMETVEKAIKSLTSFMPDIRLGTSIVAKEFNKLGVEVEGADGELRGMSEIFPEVLTALADMENVTERNAIALKIFGARAGQQLFPILNAGSEGIERLTKRAHELGLVMSDEGIKSLVTYKDKMDELSRAVKAGLTKAISENIGEVNILIERLSESVPAAMTSAIEGINSLSGTMSDMVNSRWWLALEQMGKAGGIGGLLGLAGLRMTGGFRGFGLESVDFDELRRQANAQRFDMTGSRAMISASRRRAEREAVEGGGGGGGGGSQVPDIPSVIAMARAAMSEFSDANLAELTDDLEQFNVSVSDSAFSLIPLSPAAEAAAAAARNMAGGADEASASALLGATAMASLEKQSDSLITGFGFAAAQAIRLGEGFGEALEQLLAQSAGSFLGDLLSLTPLSPFADSIGNAAGQIFGAVVGPRERRELTARVGIDAIEFTSQQRQRFFEQ